MNPKRLRLVAAALGAALGCGDAGTASDGEPKQLTLHQGLGQMRQALSECRLEVVPYDGGLELLRTCSDGQVCFSDCPFIPALGEHYLGRERCRPDLPRPAALECVPGARRCLAAAAQACAGEGRWVTESTCSNGCIGRGVCQAPPQPPPVIRPDPRPTCPRCQIP